MKLKDQIEGNPYWDWILKYSAEDIQQAVVVGTGKSYFSVCLTFH